ncbi:hypothetical protein HZC09_04465 [Candidatus Micrarchaeota archaeon]|nr:hypothetical protein [Candidatus Micrarchaeota archaeon]
MRGYSIRGQASIEYILLVGFGLTVVIIGFALMSYVGNFTHDTLGQVDKTRNEMMGFQTKEATPIPAGTAPPPTQTPSATPTGTTTPG